MNQAEVRRLYRLLASIMDTGFIDEAHRAEWQAIQESRPKPPDGWAGVSHIIGKWPGEETDEQVEEALRKLS